MCRSFEFNNIPLGYLITFRGHGTWLHGDKRGSVDRFHNLYGSPRLPHNERWREYNRQELRHPPVKLSSDQRQVFEAGIRETCQIRKWDLWAINARSNHIHTVVSANCKPEIVLIALKANATRKLREAGFWLHSTSPWANRGSKKYLWTEKDVNDAIAYVQYDQGEPLP
ncbi:MAG: transposase [Acidobacteriota bacterium]|nr:transposase [Acidobacteriota bacterium]